MPYMVNERYARSLVVLYLLNSFSSVDFSRVLIAYQFTLSHVRSCSH